MRPASSSVDVTFRSGLTWGAPLAGYSLLACLLTWPLPLSLRTHLLGAVSGDISVYVWNLWIFRHELLEHGRLPVSTDHVFAYTNGADFALHNYTPLADALGLPLIGLMGLVGAFNFLLLVEIVVTALGVFLLCRSLGLARSSAWCAGALFVASPLMVARQTAHPSLVAAAALPFFLWALRRTLDSGRRRDGALVGVLVALATYSDAYYGVYCALMGVVVLLWRFLRVEPGDEPVAAAVLRTIDVLIALSLALVVWRLLTGATVIDLGPLRATLTTFYNPVLALTVSVLLRIGLTWRPRLRVRDGARVRALVPVGLVACGVCLVLLLPLLLGIGMRLQQGRLPGTVTYWRSSPGGVDLFSYLVPNPNHPVLGRWTRDALLPDRPDAFPEFVAAFSWVAFALIGVAAARRKLPAFWVAFTLFFAALSLGPFIHIAGQNTYVIGPWALLRYMPIIDMARSPARFAVVATLGLCVLFAFAQEAWLRRRGTGRLTGVALTVAMAAELLPAPRTLFSAHIPEVYGLIAASADRSARVLQLPTGIRDGTSSLGDFNPATMYFQTRHGRPLIGGYLSRVSEFRKQQNHRLPVLRALNALSEPGFVVPPEWLTEASQGRDRFFSRSCVGFVVVDRRKASPALQAFAVDVLRLTSVHRDEGYDLLVPVDPPTCVSRGRGSQAE